MDLVWLKHALISTKGMLLYDSTNDNFKQLKSSGNGNGSMGHFTEPVCGRLGVTP
ncbi:MAG: hypothetical protein DHS20C17_26620 [Cyclobacteriaceae bacterium]|nr:MAG: hypothetical protein DHS20C17_26620 [Cyclobacteriaceae bacterium]